MTIVKSSCMTGKIRTLTPTMSSVYCGLSLEPTTAENNRIYISLTSPGSRWIKNKNVTKDVWKKTSAMNTWPIFFQLLFNKLQSMVYVTLACYVRKMISPFYIYLCRSVMKHGGNCHFKFVNVHSFSVFSYSFLAFSI